MDTIKQQSLFGGEQDIQQLSKPIKTNRTIKQKFRHHTGYDNAHVCKNCTYLVCHNHNNRNYYKCDKMGQSSSSATDIRLSDKACKYFKEETK